MVSWDSHRVLLAGSILGMCGAHMEPNPLDDSHGLVVPYLLDDLGLAKMAIAETHW